MNDHMDSIEARCREQNPVVNAGRFPVGTVFGDWRLTAFIGSGGNGEVYCAEHVALGTPAAVKVLMRDELRAKARFEREAKLLAALKSSAFPRFFAYGEANGRAYLVMELLEPGDLPTGDKAVAGFMVRLCDAVAELHAHGLVHRDIKPGNILWRKAEPVLSDLGLVKDTTQSNQFTAQLSDQATLGGVGTPGYGAPEQMERGEATVASDIHSLGVLADRCFDGNPPRTWARIIRRATSSIPAHRYPSVVAFVRESRRRNLLRMAVFSLSAAVILGIITAGVVMLSGPVAGEADGEAIGNDGGEGVKWRSMCKRGGIESIEKKYILLQSSKSGRKRYRVVPVTNVVEGTLVRLPAEKVVFSEPIILDPGTYRIIGPGRLDADISGTTDVVVRLKGCVLNNMTALSYPKNGVRYVFEGGAYLNFARLKRGDPLNRNIKFSDKGGDALEFGGPLTREELHEKRRADRAHEWREEVERENSARDSYRIY